MEAPGMSLFRGAPSIHINNSVQDRLEEQEELEDQKRRNEELKHKLDNAFDDLVDDDDASSVNSSANFTMNPTQSNSGQAPHTTADDPKIRNLPTYVESLNHLKDVPCSDNRVHCETPKSHQSPYVHSNEPNKYAYNAYGGGDGQTNFYQHYTAHMNGINNYETNQDLMNHEQLQIMYDMRVKECQQLAEHLEALKTHADTETESLRGRLAAACSERDRAELSLQQAHHLLASTKHTIVELEQKISSLNERVIEGQQEREQLKLELRSATVSLQDAQQRLHTAQVAHTHDTDALFREQQDRHREEIERLHGDYLKTKNRLEEKEKEIKILENRCLAKDREKEELLLEKGSKINCLANELEKAQSKLVSGEAARLKERLAQITNERNAAREQVKELGSKLEITAHELVLCRNKCSNTQKQFEEWRGTLHQILQEAVPDQSYLGDPSTPSKLATLKEILNRYRHQGQKLSTLQEEIAKRDKKLEHHRKHESDLNSKLEELKGIEMQLNSRVAVLQNKLDLLGNSTDGDLISNYKHHNAQLQEQVDELRKELKAVELKYAELEIEHERVVGERSGQANMAQEANADLIRELDRCSGHLKDTLKECSELKNLYLDACCAREAVSRELQDAKSKLAQLQKEKESVTSQEKELMERLERERQQVSKLTSDLASEREDLERANRRISELQKEFTDKQKEFTNRLNKYIEEERSAVRKELETCLMCEKYIEVIRNLEEQLAKCNLRIATQESNGELMQELRNKGEFFEKYILERFQKMQDKRHVATNTDADAAASERETTDNRPPHGEDKDADSENFASRTDLMMKEKEIRDQIAEKFTLEMKTIEMNYTKKLKEMENAGLQTVSKLKQLLETKAEEVETLKKLILAERSKITEILDAKENEISILIKENNSLQEDYQELRAKTVELKAGFEKAQSKVAKLKSELDKRCAEATSERERSDRGRMELTQRVQVLEAKVSQMEAQHELLKEKYRNVKKTALVYKEYASKKDEHVAGELERIKTHYKDIVSQLQDKLQNAVKRRQQHEVSERINKIQSDFNAIISEGHSSQQS